MMARKPRGLTESDRAAWGAYAGRIAPLSGRSLPKQPVQQELRDEPGSLAPAPDPPPRVGLPPRAAPARAAHRPLAVGDAPGGVDSATWQRLRGGKLSPERSLDLHGLTVQRAFQALVAFLRSAHADRLRCVEVITGRGSRDEIGVLRRELPLWLNRSDIRPLVLAAAHPHAANPGSVLLLLRRVR
jgi:DNA-nicking Smr family endonuclease